MKRRMDVLFVFISIILGIILEVIMEIPVYDKILNIFGLESRIAVITIYFAIFALVLGVILLLKGLRNDTFVNFGKVMGFTLLALIAFVGCSALFEFLYELGGNDPSKRVSDIQYVFLIDDSGSMGGNDPDDERYDAVETIINNMTPTDNFAVYSFESQTKCLTPINSENSQGYSISKPSGGGGGTYMMGAINQAIEDVAENSNKYTKIIILTDGYPSDASFFNKQNKVVKTAVKENTSISSVGFGSPDEQFLTDLAVNTGGTYVFSDNIDTLTNDLDTIIKAQTGPMEANRDLLGERLDLTADSFWYGFLRVLFLILLGGLWTIVKLLLIGEKKFTQMSAVCSLVLCSLGAILCELLCLIGIGPISFFARVLLCALWACTLIPKEVFQKANLGNALHSGQNSGASRSLSDDFKDNRQGVGGSKSFL